MGTKLSLNIFSYYEINILKNLWLKADAKK